MAENVMRAFVRRNLFAQRCPCERPDFFTVHVRIVTIMNEILKFSCCFNLEIWDNTVCYVRLRGCVLYCKSSAQQRKEDDDDAVLFVFLQGERTSTCLNNCFSQKTCAYTMN